MPPALPTDGDLIYRSTVQLISGIIASLIGCALLWQFRKNGNKWYSCNKNDNDEWKTLQRLSLLMCLCIAISAFLAITGTTAFVPSVTASHCLLRLFYFF